MKLTTEILARYIGCQVEIQNQEEGYLYRGEIKTAELTPDGDVSLTFNWVAKALGLVPGKPPIPVDGWEKDETHPTYIASLLLYGVSNIGPTRPGTDDRICLSSPIVGETTIFYPSNGSKLDMTKVKGFNLEPQKAS